MGLGAIGGFLGGVGQAAGGIGQLGTSLFGGGQSGSQSGTTETKGTTTERMKIDQEAIDKIVSDILGSEQGLANIFSGEQQAGIFDSSVSSLAASDLIANLAGEIAKLKAEKETEIDTTATNTSKSKTKQKGLLDSIF